MDAHDPTPSNAGDNQHPHRQHVLLMALLVALLLGVLADVSGESNAHAALAPYAVMAAARHARQPDLARMTAMAVIAVDRQSLQPSLLNGGERMSLLCKKAKSISKNRENRGKQGYLLKSDYRDLDSPSLPSYQHCLHTGIPLLSPCSDAKCWRPKRTTPVFSRTGLARKQLLPSAPPFVACYPCFSDRHP